MLSVNFARKQHVSSVPAKHLFHGRVLWLTQRRIKSQSMGFKRRRSQAAPLAAGDSQSELGAASVRYHSLCAECLGILTFWKRNRKTQAAGSPGIITGNYIVYQVIQAGCSIMDGLPFQSGIFMAVTGVWDINRCHQEKPGIYFLVSCNKFLYTNIIFFQLL